MSLLLFVSISGCQVAAIPVATAMNLANVADEHTAGNGARILWDQQREYVRQLRAHGDPMGDYLYALGNAQGWIGDTSDPLQIRSLFEKAADEGSNDAKIVLGIFYFNGVVPSSFVGVNSIRLPDNLVDHQRGLQLIREGMRVRCTYAEPVVSAYANRAYLRYVSAASRIWPNYRDGQYRRNASGSYVTILEKDRRLEKEWHDLDTKCHISGATTE